MDRASRVKRIAIPATLVALVAGGVVASPKTAVVGCAPGEDEGDAGCTCFALKDGGMFEELDGGVVAEPCTSAREQDLRRWNCIVV